MYKSAPDFARENAGNENAAQCLAYNFHNSSSALCSQLASAGSGWQGACRTKLETRLKCSRPARINWPAAAERELVSIVGQEVSADARDERRARRRPKRQRGWIL